MMAMAVAALHSFDIEVAEAINTNPEIVSTPDPTTIEVGRRFVYQIVGVDDEQDALNYSILMGPEFLRINPTLGIVTWVPLRNQIGSHEVLIQVRDDHGAANVHSFQLQVVEPNVAPVFVSTPGQVAVVGSTYEYTIEVYDGNPEDSVELVLEEFHPDMDFDGELRVLTWTPTEEVSDQVVRIRATDDTGTSSIQEFTISAVDSAPNEPPLIVSTPRTTTRLGLPWAYVVAVEQADSDQLTFSLVDAPIGMTIEDGGIVFWDSPSSELATYPVTLRVDDGRGGFDQQMFELTVVNSDSNSAPVISSNPIAYARVDELYAYEITAIDAENDFVLWRLLEGPSGAAIDQDSGVLRWVPSLDQVGVREFVVEAMDIYGAMSTQTFSVQVTCVNHVPLIESIPGTEATTGQAYFYAIRARDPESGTLSFELNAAPDGMTIDSESGLVRWVPGFFVCGSDGSRFSRCYG